jgi:DNA-binding CsgD family transcriptional regulator
VSTARLRSADLEALLDLVLDLDAAEDLDDFVRRTLRGVRRLIPCDLASWNEMDTLRDHALVVTDPEDAVIDGSAHAIRIDLPTASGVTIRLARTRRGFGDREVALLDLARAHLGKAHGAADVRSRLRLEWRAEDVAPIRPDASVESEMPSGLGLTPRQTQVLGLVAQGKTNPEVARLLSITRRTVAKHLEQIYRKLGVNTRAGAAAAYRAAAGR